MPILPARILKSVIRIFALLFCVGLLRAEEKISAERSTSTVILNEIGVKNLRIETLEVEESEFEEIVFALGRVEAVPSKVSAVSSRIPGRVVELKVAVGDQVSRGQEVARLESRQPGDPPPTVPLKALQPGLVTRIDARLGDPLELDKALMEIVDLSEVHAVARVPEHQAGRLKPGTRAHIAVSALPNEKFEGELLRFGTTVDKATGTIDAIFLLPNASALLRTDMRAEFSIVVEKRGGVMSVPRSALQGDPAGRFVYVEDFELKHAYVKTWVQVGQVTERAAEIIAGLLPGDKVVTRGAYSLSFAGGGSISLKEALDAAHGHEHAADGSELKPGAHAGPEKQGNDAHHHHDDDFWKIVSGVLLVLLVVSLALKRKPRTGPEKSGVKKSEGH